MATKKKVEAKKPEPQKISSILISEVLCGKWGEGKERNEALRQAGYNPSLVTKKINELRKVFEANAEMFIGLGDYVYCITLLYPHD